MKNNNFLVFIPLLLLGSTVAKPPGDRKVNVGASISNFVNDISKSLTIDDINHSVDTLRKIGPYLPEPYVEKVNSLVFNFDKMNKVAELAEFLSSKQPSNSVITTQNVSSKERFNRILLTLKDDIPDDKIKNIRPLIDLVANFDKYKGMVGIMSSLSNTSEKPEDKMENMMNMVMPLLGQNEESASKVKDMMKVFQTLASTSSESKSNNDDDED